MSCVKTGARLRFDNYGCTVPADLYVVENVWIARVTPDHFQDDRRFDLEVNKAATHRIGSVPGGGDFWRDDIGVFVVPFEYLEAL